MTDGSSPHAAPYAGRQVALATRHGTERVIASEGSFGPHPAVPLLAVGRECMVFLDADRDLCIEEELLARRTNVSHRLLEPPCRNGNPVDPGLESWLAQVGFPSHALLVRPHHADTPEPVLAKGIFGASPAPVPAAAVRVGDGSAWNQACPAAGAASPRV